MTILELNGRTDPELKEQLLGRICALDREIFDDSAWGRDAFLENIDNEYDYLIAAFEEQTDRESVRHGTVHVETAGYALLRCFDDAEIIMIATDPAFRRRGTGDALLKGLTEEAARRHAGSIFLEVRESNDAARAMYRKAGFVEKGIRRNYYHAPLENAVVMQLELRAGG
jgi:ribosomal-protein-alanine N-acetyltransferase